MEEKTFRVEMGQYAYVRYLEFRGLDSLKDFRNYAKGFKDWHVGDDSKMLGFDGSDFYHVDVDRELKSLDDRLERLRFLGARHIEDYTQFLEALKEYRATLEPK